MNEYDPLSRDRESLSAAHQDFGALLNQIRDYSAVNARNFEAAKVLRALCQQKIRYQQTANIAAHSLNAPIQKD